MSLLFAVAAFVTTGAAVAVPAPVHRVVLDAPITPIQAEYVERALAQAAREGSQLVLLELDTPGGLGVAMEDVIRHVLASRVPVCAFVHPPGGRAASAGFFILVSADLAAMAPGTRAGAAHPVLSIGGVIPVGDEPPRAGDDEAADGGSSAERGAKGAGSTATLMEKVEKDARAFLRAVAQERGRDAEAAERAVTENRSYTDREALDAGLIDLVAASERELLQRLDGREVRLLDGSTRRLATRDAPIVDLERSFRERALAFLADGNVAFLLLLVGLLLVYFEVTHAGAIVPGVVGGILLLLGLIGLSLLPINVGGVLLLLAGAGLLAAELFVPGFGVLGVGGMVCLAFGAITLVDAPDASLAVEPALAVIAAASVGGLALLLGWLALRASRQRARGGLESLVGEEGEVVVELALEGKVLLHGEYWNAVAAVRVPRGARVRCVRAAGMTLEVEPLAGGEEQGDER
ncbi:MAG: nodulation protein NfeD [Deltaproteobacteria bacterium]|nr:nodulation protein NfeD [Deltaproteobacteria bacterium]